MPDRASLLRAAIFVALATVSITTVSVNGRQPSSSTPPSAAGTQTQSRTQTFDQPVPGALSPRNANYTIEATLDHATRTIRGRETIVWRNISANPTSELRFHLYWNAWRDLNSTWLRERKMAGLSVTTRPDAFGSIDVTALRLVSGSSRTDLTSQMQFVSPDDASETDRTVMSVPLAMPVGPNESVQLEIDWTAAIPRPFARTGYIDDYYFIAQWFPKLGVLEDGGWNAHQFHAPTEFYADYGVYDLALTVPKGFVVGASGAERGVRENSDGTATHLFHGEDIHDAAWTASPEYREYRQVFQHGQLPRVEMRLLLLPEHEGLQDRYFAATAAALRYYGEWFGPYPYPNITIVDPAYQSAADGMEYPTLFTGRARWISPTGMLVPESTTIHEAGHQFWYGIIGSNEFENGWMDEGLNTYSTARVIDVAFQPNFVERRFFGGFVPWVFRDIPTSRLDQDRLPGYRDNPEADVPATPTFKYWPATASTITYNKTALWLNTLERHLGWPKMQRIMSTYFARWKFRHPTPQDFFDVANEVSGQDLTWFFDQVYRSSNTFDYGVQDFSSEKVGDRYRVTAVFRRYGEATFPVDVRIRLRGGSTLGDRWDGRDRRYVMTYLTKEPALTAEVDPNRVLMLDVNYANNSRTLAPKSDDASLKWGLKWMVWLQDLMLTYGFFV